MTPTGRVDLGNTDAQVPLDDEEADPVQFAACALPVDAPVDELLTRAEEC